MKYLIVDDNPHKIERIEKVMKILIPDIKRLVEFDLSSGLATLKENIDDIDFIISDMQFPETPNGRINIVSGIKFVNKVKLLNLKHDKKIPVCVASSDSGIQSLLDSNGLSDIYGIIAEAQYSLRGQFEKWFETEKEFLNILPSDLTNGAASNDREETIKRYMNNLKQGGYKKPKVVTEDDKKRLELAELKRVLKQAKQTVQKDNCVDNKLKLEVAKKKFKDFKESM